MSETSKSYNELDSYIAAFSEEERQEYAAAETALDLACMLYHIRQEQGLTQGEAAARVQERLRFLLLKSNLYVVCIDLCQDLKQFSNFLAAQVKRSLSHSQFKHAIVGKKCGSKAVKQPDTCLLCDV